MASLFWMVMNQTCLFTLMICTRLESPRKNLKPTNKIKDTCRLSSVLKLWNTLESIASPGRPLNFRSSKPLEAILNFLNEITDYFYGYFYFYFYFYCYCYLYFGIAFHFVSAIKISKVSIFKFRNVNLFLYVLHFGSVLV